LQADRGVFPDGAYCSPGARCRQGSSRPAQRRPYAACPALAANGNRPTAIIQRLRFNARAIWSYGADGPDIFRKTALYVAKILQGGKPANLPVEQPTKFELIVNLVTAKALGIVIPESFLVAADEVIE